MSAPAVGPTKRYNIYWYMLYRTPSILVPMAPWIEMFPDRPPGPPQQRPLSAALQAQGRRLRLSEGSHSVLHGNLFSMGGGGKARRRRQRSAHPGAKGGKGAGGAEPQPSDAAPWDPQGPLASPAETRRALDTVASGLSMVAAALAAITAQAGPPTTTLTPQPPTYPPPPQAGPSVGRNTERNHRRKTQREARRREVPTEEVKSEWDGHEAYAASPHPLARQEAPSEAPAPWWPAPVVPDAERGLLRLAEWQTTRDSRDARGSAAPAPGGATYHGPAPKQPPAPKLSSLKRAPPGEPVEVQLGTPHQTATWTWANGMRARRTTRFTTWSQAALAKVPRRYRDPPEQDGESPRPEQRDHYSWRQQPLAEEQEAHRPRERDEERQQPRPGGPPVEDERRGRAKEHEAHRPRERAEERHQPRPGPSVEDERRGHAKAAAHRPRERYEARHQPRPDPWGEDERSGHAMAQRDEGRSRHPVPPPRGSVGRSMVATRMAPVPAATSKAPPTFPTFPPTFPSQVGCGAHIRGRHPPQEDGESCSYVSYDYYSASEDEAPPAQRRSPSPQRRSADSSSPDLTVRVVPGPGDAAARSRPARPASPYSPH
jgi:hypothetical protein